jgi:hypothetical protein
VLTRRFPLSGLFAVLLALMAQLGAGATVPQIDPVGAADLLCHTGDDGTPPANAPAHPADCPLCPLCATLHAQQAVLVSAPPRLTLPSVLAVRRAELSPPSTAPPAPHRPPSQPRAPPIAS